MSVAVLLSAPPSHALAFLEGIGAMEMMLVAVIGLLLFGGKGLPDMARTIGKVVREFKKASANVEEEVKRVMNEEPSPRRSPRPPRIVTPKTPQPPPATDAAPEQTAAPKTAATDPLRVSPPPPPSPEA